MPAPTTAEAIADAVTDGLAGFEDIVLLVLPVVIGIAVIPLGARLAWRLVKSFVA